MAKVIKIPADVSQEMEVIDIGNMGWREAAQSIGADYIEQVRIGDCLNQRGWDHMRMLVDETGRLKSLPYNRRGSILYGEPLHGQFIAGDAIIVGELLLNYEDGPEWVGLDHEGMSGNYGVGDMVSTLITTPEECMDALKVHFEAVHEAVPAYL